MHSFVRSLITEWRRLTLPCDGEAVVVGVSGGADSVSLLLALDELRQTKKLDIRLVAAHFNHHLRGPESDADEEFVRQLTVERKIELSVGHAKQLGPGNTEQNARNARYQFLHRTAENVGAAAIATGHTMNDQAETFLMNLIRGSGVDGLCGMRAVRLAGDVPPPSADGCEPHDAEEDEHGPLLFTTSRLLVRPLLTWAKRRDTEGYCHSLGVEYRYDTMNEDTAFRRVRIRKILLPLLHDFNPRIIETLASTAMLMQSLPDLPSANTGRELKVSDLVEIERHQVGETIRSWLSKQRGSTRSLQLKHIEAVERLVFSGKSGRVVELPGGRVTKSKGRLVYDNN
jgi:tRNA(Ile)-lysidine synthase